VSATARKEDPMIECLKIAKYFLSCVDEDAEDSLSNLKRQKLLYYAQGLHLALYDEPLFCGPILAWTHGPVVAGICHKYKEFGANPIPKEEIDFADYDLRTREILDEVWDVYGQFSGSKLRNMTHQESP